MRVRLLYYNERREKGVERQVRQKCEKLVKLLIKLIN